MSVVVLMYHGVGDPAPNGEPHYTFAEEQLHRHLHLLRGRVASLQDLLQGRARAGQVVLTFDDGEQSVARLALPLMQRHQMTGTVFVTTGWIDSPGYLTAGEVAQLDRAGWIIGSHGVTHRFLSDLPDDELRRELTDSRDTLTRLLGHPPLDISLPGGREDRRVLRQVQDAGYRSLSTSSVGVNCLPLGDPYRIRRTMMIRTFDEATVGRIVDGDRRFYLTLQARQGALGLAKRAMGNRRYMRVRALAFSALQRLRRR